MAHAQRLAAFGLISALTLSSAAVTLIAPAPVLAGNASHHSQKQVIRSGAFTSGAHPTTGKAKLINKNGKYFIKLDSAFKTDDGPDLFVVLHRSRTPKDYTSENYVNLGRLQKIEGKQVYELPSSIKDPSVYESVVVWCKEFNVTFGHANLDG